MIFIPRVNGLVGLILTCYCIAMTIQLITLVLNLVLWKKLPHRFRIMALVSVFIFFMAFAASVFFIVTLNYEDVCIYVRKCIYTLVYAAFFVYDVYQFMKIKAITLPGKWANVTLFAFLGLRFSSYVVNLVMVGSKVTGTELDPEGFGRGSCTTSFPIWTIYQEHFVSVVFELVLGLQLYFYLEALSKKHGKDLPTLFRSVIDMETISFGVYFAIEIAYLLVYSMIPTSSVSMLNSFYLMVPVLLFLINIFVFWLRKLGTDEENEMAKTRPV